MFSGGQKVKVALPIWKNWYKLTFCSNLSGEIVPKKKLKMHGIYWKDTYIVFNVRFGSFDNICQWQIIIVIALFQYFFNISLSIWKAITQIPEEVEMIFFAHK